MQQEVKQIFTRRIVESNRSELIVVLFDIFDCYVEEAQKAYEKGAGSVDVLDSLRHACLVLEHLKDDLDFRSDRKLCEGLFSIYDYCQRQIARSLYQNNTDGVTQARKLMSELRTSFVEVAKEDRSEPLLDNRDNR
ncbi:MAG: flagellar protein FliS, partial [Lachnospiraceae bacterium]|nr:flagellar protein FliS [Lachnospiraceae bacterium]